jgi:YD repeat-containing protein
VYLGTGGGCPTSLLHCRHVRSIGTDGIIRRVAGNDLAGFAGDGGPPTAATLFGAQGIAVGPDNKLYFSDLARIRAVSPTMPAFSSEEMLIPSEDARELYVFDASGRHLRTFDIYARVNAHTFGYDSAGRLVTITDRDGNVTEVHRDGTGNPTSIEGPFGPTTTITLDAKGYIDTLTNPASEVMNFDYTPSGLLTQYTDPRTNDFDYTYDALGRLTLAEDPAGGSKTLVRTEIANGHQVATTTELGRTTTHKVENLPSGELRITVTEPSGAQRISVTGTDRKTTVTDPDGTIAVSEMAGDPRWGMLTPFTKTATTTTPGGKQEVVNSTRSVTLSNPNDTTTLTSLTETNTITGSGLPARLYTTAYNYNNPGGTLVMTSPEGRPITRTFNAVGHMSGIQVEGLNVTALTYNAGRPASSTAGSGMDVRTTTMTYQPADGYLDTTTDTGGRVFEYDYDGVGRLTDIDLPDPNNVGFGYDANGNMTSVTPPGQLQHGFQYSPVNLEAVYNPPDLVGVPTDTTNTAHNADRQLDLVTRPDSVTIDSGYDTAGRISSVAERRVDYTGPEPLIYIRWLAYNERDRKWHGDRECGIYLRQLLQNGYSDC